MRYGSRVCADGSVRSVRSVNIFRLALPSGEELACRWSPAAPTSNEGGATILYLHGFGSQQEGEKADFFRARAHEVGLGFFSFDFRGHGQSGGSMLELSLTRCLEDVDAVAEYLGGEGAERLLILGSSMGGLVGLWWAALHPDRAEAGLYIAPAVGLAEGIAGLIGEEGMRHWREEGSLPITNELGTFDVGWSLVADLDNYPSERLAEIHSVPSLIFQGKLDDRVSWESVAELAEAAGEAARLVLYEDGDHRLLDRRDEMWTRMDEFLNRAVGARQPSEAALQS